MTGQEDRRAYMRAYYEANKERLTEYHREYTKAHRARINERSKKYRDANRERVRDRQRAYYLANKAEIDAYQAAYQARNKERLQDYWARYYLDRIDQYTVRNREYRQSPAGKEADRAKRMRRRGAPMDAKAKEWVAVLLNDPCVYCGGEADTIDHIEPISAGGSGEWDNLAAACRKCNSTKNDRPLLIHLLRERRRSDEAA